MDESVAVGVGRRREKGPHLLAVEVKARRGVVVTTGRAPAGGCGEKRASPARGPQLLQRPHPDVVMGQDQDVHPGERLVAADVVRVHVRVDQEADLAVRHTPHRGDQPLGQRREQRINEQHTVRPGEDADVAASARALDHVDLARHGHGRQLDAREPVSLILSSGADGDDRHAERGKSWDDDTGMSAHRTAPRTRYSHEIRLALSSRKLRARLRTTGLRTTKARVLRLRRKAQLLWVRPFRTLPT